MKKNFFSLIFLLMLFCLCSCNNSNTGRTKQNEALAVPEVKAVFINGDSIHYIDIGKGDPIVFVHGSLGDYRTWEAQMDTFAKNHRVIAYSRRYAFPNKQVIHDSADYTVTPHAKDLVEFIKALNLEPVHLVGHSYGAFTALLATINHPELVRSLTLGEPPVMSLLQNVPGGDTMVNNFVTKAIIPASEAFKNNDQEKAVILFITAVMDDSLYFSKLPQRDQELVLANTLETRGSVFTKSLFPPVSCGDLGKIKTPVLLVTGDKSPLFLTSIIKELDRCLSNKEKATLHNTTHGLEYENPSEFNNAVLGFVDKH
jgi:pimeloyl-ACP methyl ester carboxylesterase